LRGDADDAAAAMEAGGQINVALFGEREALGTAQSAIPGTGVAVGLDGPDGVVGAKRGAGDKEGSGGVDCDVIGGRAGLEGGVDEDLAGSC
jgi:hypothetical protein